MISARLQSLEKNSSSLSSEDGELQIIIGVKGRGKTSFALDILPKRKHLIICPGATNPDILAYQYRYNDDAGLKRALQVKNRVVYTYLTNLNLFEYLTEDGLVLLLDDIRMILNHKALRSAFEEWVRGIRWRHQKVIITTHRPVGDMAPIAYDMASKIFWVGKLKDREEADLLWRHKDLDCTKEEWYAKLESLEKYNYSTQNVSQSVFQIKSD